VRYEQIGSDALRRGVEITLDIYINPRLGWGKNVAKPRTWEVEASPHFTLGNEKLRSDITE
jgi:hypothetical protein